MKSISFVNGANILGRSLITGLGKSVQKIKLLDPRPFRPAVCKILNTSTIKALLGI